MLEKILGLLPAKGLDQEQLERLADLSQGRISKWKRGVGEPTVKQAVRISRVLGVPVAYLVDDARTDPADDGLTEDERLILLNARRMGIGLAYSRLVGLDQQSAASREGSRTTGREVGLSGSGAERLPDPPASGKTGRSSG